MNGLRVSPGLELCRRHHWRAEDVRLAAGAPGLEWLSVPRWDPYAAGSMPLDEAAGFMRACLDEYLVELEDPERPTVTSPCLDPSPT
jgi:hypothetical protein